MNSHTLAAMLLNMQDLPVATHAHNHTYMSDMDASSHGEMEVRLMHAYQQDYIVLGDMAENFEAIFRSAGPII